MKDIEKRKRVMRRSMRLGHCICDLKKACPCDFFRVQDLCPCAGERAEEPSGPVRLTTLVDSPGCASKIDQATLQRVLGGLPFVADPRVLVGAPAGDDAGVMKLDDHLALVQTVDVFSPPVDDPYLFGQIAAANSLSDVYAMGGRPISALSIVGFPVRTLAEEVMHQILRGGVDKMAEAGVAVLGGHSIQQQEIRAGFAVTGLIHPDEIVTNAAVRPGDRLILTKSLGTGIVAFAAQLGRAAPGAVEAAGRSMAALNRQAAELMLEFAAHACTDVTGFGLAGHLAAMAAASHVDVEIIWDDLPLLPDVLECLADEVIPGAVERNRESSASRLVADQSLPPAMVDICFDPQTSGGLLIAVAPTVAEALLERLRAGGIAEAAVIGTALGAGDGRVFLRHAGRRKIPAPQPSASVAEAVAPATAAVAEVSENQEASNMSCCSDDHSAGSHTAGEAAAPLAGTSAVQQKFHEFLKVANAPGALDAHTKQALALALSVLAKCEPCLKVHLKKAKEMGFSQAEIDEAAWMAIAFGGSPTLMFYNRVKG